MVNAFIWDLDGTLFDSYPMIVPSLRQTLLEKGLDMEEAAIRQIILRDSVTTLLELGSEKTGQPFDALMKRYKAISEGRLMEIQLLPGAREVLTALEELGAVHYVYTHRGASSEPLLKNLGIWDFFKEVVTSRYALPRKPAPDGIAYLMKKYHLSLENTCYVGDRRLDMECAHNAGVKSVLLRTPESPTVPLGTETAVVQSLADLPLLMEQGML